MIFIFGFYSKIDLNEITYQVLILLVKLFRKKATFIFEGCEVVR